MRQRSAGELKAGASLPLLLRADRATEPGVPILRQKHLNTRAETAPSAPRALAECAPKCPSRLSQCCKPSDVPSNQLCLRATSASGASQMLPKAEVEISNAEAKESVMPRRQSVVKGC